MTETKTPKPKAAPKTANAAPKTETPADVFAITGFEIPGFEMPGFEMPEAARQWAETGIDNVRKAYGSIREASEKVTDLAEEALTVSRDGITDLNMKALDNAKASADAGFAFLREMLGAKTVAEAVELQSRFARERMEALTGQTREFHDAATKLAQDFSKPISQAFNRDFM